MKKSKFILLISFVSVFILGVVLGSKLIPTDRDRSEGANVQTYSITSDDGSWSVESTLTDNAIFINSFIVGIGSCSINGINLDSADRDIGFLIIDEIRKVSISYDRDGVLKQEPLLPQVR